MKSTKSILQELTTTKKRIQQLEDQSSALKSSLISEGLLDMLVDAILGPFLHMSAVNMRNTPEYKATVAKIKELDKLQKKLQTKSDKLAKEAEKAQEEYNKKHSNIKSYTKTKALK